LLNALLNLENDDKIVSLKFLNPFNYKEFNEQKMSVVDTRVKDHLGRTYNIEVQLLPDLAFVPRSVYYLARLYSNQLEKGKGYELLNKATGVSILGFNLFKSSNQIVETFNFKNVRADLELPETMELFYIDMTRFDIDKPRKLRNRFEKWLHIMKFGEIYVKLNAKVDKELGEEEGIESVVKELKKINSDAEMRQLMELHERTETCLALTRGYAFKEGRQLGRTEGREEGRREGIIEGIKEGRREGEALICLNMFERGMSTADIANATGLNENQVLELINIAKKDHKVSEPASRYKTRKPRKKT
jgi:predicted transposase/invertase (TIGR01784 family)